MIQVIPEEMSKIDIMIEDVITKCETHSFKARASAADLRKNGFDGQVVADLIRQCELALKNAHAYQSYINTLACE